MSCRTCGIPITRCLRIIFESLLLDSPLTWTRSSSRILWIQSYLRYSAEWPLHLIVEQRVFLCKVNWNHGIRIKKRIYKQNSSNRAKLDGVGAILERSPQKSITKLTRQTGVSVSSARNAARLLSLKLYHYTPVHALKDDANLRVNHCNWFLESVETGLIYHNSCFSNRHRLHFTNWGVTSNWNENFSWRTKKSEPEYIYEVETCSTPHMQ